MKYEAKNVGGIATSQAAGTPWVSISQTDSITTSAAACTGCHLITEAEWMTIAQNVLNVGSNWDNGAGGHTVGTGYIYSGHNDNAPANALAVTNTNDGYSDTGNSAPSNQRRTLTLSNGEVIWDLAGNVWEWTSGTTAGGQPGITGENGYSWKDWNVVTVPGSMSPNPSPTTTGIPGAGSWTAGTQGIGRLFSWSDWAGGLKGVYRSGNWSAGGNVGVLTLGLDGSPSVAGANLGFRVSR